MNTVSVEVQKLIAELQSRIVTGDDLHAPVPTTLIELPIETVEFIGSSELMDDEWSYTTYETIWEACRRWYEAKQ